MTGPWHVREFTRPGDPWARPFAVENTETGKMLPKKDGSYRTFASKEAAQRAADQANNCFRESGQ